jgi:nitrate/TMAO reductase-like tetraheme cytochrome c subunit
MIGPARAILAALLLAGAAFVVAGLAGFFGELPSEDLGPAARFSSSAQCAECHAEVYAEWETTWHAQAFTDPDVRWLSNDFEQVECIDCHAPRPVFETGLASPPLRRADRRTEGVDCIACHRTPEGFAGPTPATAGGCGPVHDARISTPEFCAGCHDQHDTVKEWRATPFAARGETCVDCHMPAIARAGGRTGRTHRWPGAHDPEAIRRALAFRVERGEGKVRIVVKNVGAGHHVPTDARHRAVDLLVRARLGEAAEARSLARYRNPYRDEGLPNTTLPFGEERSYEVDLPGGPGEMEILLTYKLTPYPVEAGAILADEAAFRDGKAFVLYRETIAF